MERERFDVIIVGGGLAGCSAAYVLAKNGVQVLLVERGNYCGSKNMTGGRLYGHSLRKIFPDFEQEAPVERKIIKEKISFMTETGATTLEYQRGSGQEAADTDSYSVLRSSFDQWMAKKAEEAGAMVICGVRIDALMEEQGRVVGVRSGTDEVYSDVVILADGVNSLLAQSIGLKQELKPEETAIGIKEIIQLDEQTVNDRFGVSEGEGTAWMMVGSPTDGAAGGAFLYTNRDSICLGIVTTVGDIGHSELSVPDMLEKVKNHPVIRPLIQDGKTTEYSAHLVTEGGYKMMPELYRDGVLVAGDAAAMVINLGYTVRGMDFAIESGNLAAQAVLEARKQGDYSGETLCVYKTMLEDSFVIRDMKRYQDFPAFMASSHRLFEDYPQVADGIMAQLFNVSGQAGDSLLMGTAKSIGKVGLVNLALDGVRGLGALM